MKTAQAYFEAAAYSSDDCATREEFAFFRGTIGPFEKADYIWQEIANVKLLRHLGQLVCEGVDDEFEAIGDAELGVD